MATSIGYQDGITALFNRLRDMDPQGTIVKKDAKGKWLPIESLSDTPIDQWKAYDKAERAFTILKDDHDAAIANPKPPPNGGGEPPPQAYLRVAPRVAYKAGGSDARYCLRDFPSLRDDVASYDPNGLCTSGTRSDGSPADCVTSALEIDGREYCSLPTMGRPEDNSGSWLV